MKVLEPKFVIGDRVYHITRESGWGVIINACYQVLSNMWEYQVAFRSDMESLWYFEHELTTTEVY